MSTAAIERVVRALKTLPESDQELVLKFLQELKRRQSTEPASAQRRGRNPAIEEQNGLLVFAGEIEDYGADWLQVVRDEREAEIMRPALKQAEGR